MERCFRRYALMQIRDYREFDRRPWTVFTDGDGVGTSVYSWNLGNAISKPGYQYAYEDIGDDAS